MTLQHSRRTNVIFFNIPPPPEIYTLSLHDALPISMPILIEFVRRIGVSNVPNSFRFVMPIISPHPFNTEQDRKSTRLNSSHSQISYAVFCLKKKKISNTGSFLALRQIASIRSWPAL